MDLPDVPRPEVIILDQPRSHTCEHCRTNLPKELMAYPDMTYPSHIHQSFIHRSDVLSYLQEYAKHFDLERFIQVN